MGRREWDEKKVVRLLACRDAVCPVRRHAPVAAGRLAVSQTGEGGGGGFTVSGRIVPDGNDGQRYRS
ncbi:hypothetical protein D3C76_1766140 [compost metagenome]